MKTKTKGYNLSIPIKDIQMVYNDVGSSRITVIFLHGFPFDKSMWDGQLEYLKSSFRVIACDMRGFGQSTDETSHLSMDLFADDLIQFMDELNLEKATICGLSMGGYIALNAIKKFPERFSGLILCDTQCIADPPEAKERRLKAIKDIESNGVFDFNDGFIKKVFYKDSLKNKKELVEDIRNVIFSNSEHIMKQGLLALAERSETCSILNEINVPTLILCGREDEVTPLVQSEMMQASIKNSKLQVIDKAGHMSNLEQPDAFNRHLLDFLNGIEDDDSKNHNGI